MGGWGGPAGESETAEGNEPTSDNFQTCWRSGSVHGIPCVITRLLLQIANIKVWHREFTKTHPFLHTFLSVRALFEPPTSSRPFGSAVPFALAPSRSGTLSLLLAVATRLEALERGGIAFGVLRRKKRKKFEQRFFIFVGTSGLLDCFCLLACAVCLWWVAGCFGCLERVWRVKVEEFSRSLVRCEDVQT